MESATVETRVRPPQWWVGVLIVIAAICVIGLGTLMVRRAESRTNQIALSQSRKLVTVQPVVTTTYRATRLYVGTIEAWVTAPIGPQIVQAYVESVLVRPGDKVKKGDVLATLDCRNVSVSGQVIALQKQALAAKQKALAEEVQRLSKLEQGGFVSTNELEQKRAQSESDSANLLAQQAKLTGNSLEANDCLLKAPFDGEIANRLVDPGSYVRPGATLMTVIDRSVVRTSVDAPEVDFSLVEPGKTMTLKLIATGREIEAKISRRSPSADAASRTVHFELDIQDPQRAIPVGTTAELRIDAGEPIEAMQIPLEAAVVKGSKANVFVIEGDKAVSKSVVVFGEKRGMLFVDPKLGVGAKVVTQGRALLSHGDLVEIKEAKDAEEAVQVKP